MFTKKHYEVLAEVIKEAQEHRYSWVLFARKLCSIFANDNIRFDHAKFIEACGFDDRTDTKE
jgi:hypothetical protein